MQINEKLAARVRELIEPESKKVEEKKMFSGLCFMVNDKMCVAVGKDRLMVRFDPALNDKVMEKEGCSPMVHSGKAIKGFVFVNDAALNAKNELEYWITLALDFNKSAKPSKKKSKSKKGY